MRNEVDPERPSQSSRRNRTIKIFVPFHKKIISVIAVLLL
jgi:predicted N-formylglutamate amidohydrolase